MSPEQRTRALRLADELDQRMLEDCTHPAADLLRELAAERVPLTDEQFEEFAEQFRWYDGDCDRYDIRGFANALLSAHGIV